MVNPMQTTILNPDNSDDQDMYLHSKLNYINSIITKCDQFTRDVLAAGYGGLDSIIGDLVRDIHSFKGTVPMYEIVLIGQICHCFEDDLFSQNVQGIPSHEQHTFRIVKFLELIKISAILQKQSLINDVLDEK